MAESQELELVGWTTTQAFGQDGGSSSDLNAYFGGGRFMTTGFTRNDSDGNISRAECAEFKFGKGGVLSGASCMHLSVWTSALPRRVIDISGKPALTTDTHAFSALLAQVE